jgi:very-short-patch-repair endonuclease
MPRETAETGRIGRFLQTREVDGRIAALATAQHGVVGRGQLAALGLGGTGVDKRLRAKKLHRLYAGVYAVGHRDVSRHGWWMAAVLASGPGAALSHRSAAALWRIRRPVDGADHVTAARKSRSSDRIRRHFGVLPPDEVTTREGIPTTTVPRTVFDLAATASQEEVEFALREAEYRRLHDALSVRDLIGRYPGHRGTRRVRIALARLSDRPCGRPASPLEEVFVPFLRRHRLPRPQLNAWLEVGRRRHRVDCLWPNRQIVELDGWEGHGTRTAFRDDRARDRRLQTAGYRVTRLTWNQLEDEPTAVAADLRALLR